MKLYIPTCTLNFNNILSSESISPLGFYARREFGNKRFYPVCANSNENAILLFSKYPLYDIDNTDFENYPMVIGIDTDDYKQNLFEHIGEQQGVEVYACCQTIYLNPFHCLFYFNSRYEIRNVLSKAEQSLENKFSKLYSANYKTIPNEEKFNWTPLYLDVKLRNSLTDVDVDVVFDRIKGFLYCFLIGANNSVSDEVAELKALSRKLSNTLSAVVHSPDRRPTIEQECDIRRNVEEFNRIYSSVDEDAGHDSAIDRDISEYINECLSRIKSLYEKYYPDSSLKVNQYCDGLKKANCDYLHRTLPYKNGFNAEVLLTCLNGSSPELFNRVTSSLNAAVSKLEKRHIGNSEKRKISELAQIEDDSHVHITDSKYKYDFYEALINSQIRDGYKKIMYERHVDEATAQAYNGGTLLKDMMGDKWENSPTSRYINGLLDHFQRSAGFDLFAIDKPVLQSFAAFCQKGDSIDRLSEYLVQCGFSEYCLAYGIYGATRGFATLPKTFTSVLIDGDRKYYQEVSKTLWKMLCGVELQDAELSQILVAQDVTGTSAKDGVNSQTSPASPREQLSVESDSALRGQKSELYKSVMSFFGSPEFDCKKSKVDLRKELVNCLEKFGGGDSYKDFLEQLADYPNWGKKTKAWRNMKNEFDPKNSSLFGKKGKTRKNKTTAASSEETGSVFASAPDANVRSKGSFFDKFTGESELYSQSDDQTGMREGVYGSNVLVGEEIDSYEGSIPFLRNNSKEIISHAAKKLGIDNKTEKQLVYDLEYVFDDQRNKGLSQTELIDEYVRWINYWKANDKSRSGTDMSWKKNMYRSLDATRIEEIIREICGLN